VGAMQRNKGRRAEQIIVNRLKEAGFDRAARNLSQTRDSGYDIIGLEPLAIEVKDHKKPNLSQWWDQTIRNATGHLIPALIYHIPNTSRWECRIPLSLINPALSDQRTATVELEDFICIAREVVT